MDNLMLDIETMGTNPYSCINSIAAVEFDITTGKTEREFFMTVDLQSCLDLGLIVNGSTIMWWLGQSNEARASLMKDPEPIADVLDSLRDFMSAEDYFVWGNSPSFDCGLIGDAYRKINQEVPWNYWNERDVRTLVSLYPQEKTHCIFEGIPHNPLDDCKHQIKYCSKIWARI